jgi:archaellum component FlaC
MSKSKNNLSKRIYVRLKENDFDILNKRLAATTCRKLSEYARRVLLNKPVTIKQRDQSLDDFMTEMIVLRNELRAIGNNFNQSVKKLHMLNEVEDIKTWLIMNENNRKNILEKVEEIKSKINQFSDKWLQ